MNNQLFNRKILFSLMAVIMCLGFTALSYGAATVSVDPATVDSPAVGEQLTININIAGGVGVAGFQATVNYDNTALSYVSAAKGDYLPGDPTAGTFILTLQPGDSNVAVIGFPFNIEDRTADGDGTLATVTFEVVEVKASSITLSDVLISDAEASALEITTADGSVTVPTADVDDGTDGDGADDGADDGAADDDGADDDGAADDGADGDDGADTDDGAADDGTDADGDDGAADDGADTDDGAADDGTDADDGAVDDGTDADDGAADDGTDADDGAADDGAVDDGTDADDGAADDGTDADADADDGAADDGTDADDGAVDDGTDVDDGTMDDTVVPDPIVPEPQVFSITLTNLTTGEPGVGGQIFSPPIFAAHLAGAKLYEVGQPASAAVVALAEGGDVSGLAAIAAAAGANTVVAEGPVLPGASVTVMVSADAMNSALSLATMLVSTNDAFIGVADLPLYDEAGMPISTSLHLTAYDAGSEQNTERGTDIPGPVGLTADEDPEGTNNRVPTEGGVITSHPGIAGVGDVLASFAWAEPTAMVTIAPYVPEPPPEPEPVLPTYDVTLAAGLNMISVPLMPTEPYTAKSLAQMLNSTVVIKLDADSQRFVGYVVVEEDDGFAIEGGKGYIVNTPVGGTVTFIGTAWSDAPAEMPMAEAAAAPKIANSSAWAFIVTSNLQEKVSGATYTMVAKNLRTGVATTETVTSEDGYVSAVWADLDQKTVVEAGDRIEISVLDEDGTIVSGPFERTVQTTDIHNAYMNVQMRVGDVRPQETILGQNFPNPFNPETWIPYELSRDSNVVIKIYDVSGHTVRELNLGHKSTGSYMTNSTAAYWDGKNEAGEHVSSGIYFYSLQTADFSATRRMVILK